MDVPAMELRLTMRAPGLFLSSGRKALHIMITEK
jgi:hypothetical protein